MAVSDKGRRSSTGPVLGDVSAVLLEVGAHDDAVGLFTVPAWARAWRVKPKVGMSGNALFRIALAENLSKLDHKYEYRRATSYRADID
jgi:hypothetical protein